MPSQRSKDKALIGGFHPKPLKELIAKIAKREGKTEVEVQREMLIDGALRRGEKLPKSLAVAE